jgi:predicted dehydrogenase
VELSALAKANGLVTAVGVQARVNPAVMHMKEQIEDGFVGEVMAVHVSLMREGVLTRPSHRTWQGDAELGANTLTIANGHTVDAMRFVAGDFRRLSAVVATQAKQWLDTGTNTLLDVTSPDNAADLSARASSSRAASSITSRKAQCERMGAEYSLPQVEITHKITIRETTTRVISQIWRFKPA